MLLDVGLHVGEYYASALHHPAAKNYNFGIVGMDQADCGCRPNLKTAVAKGQCDWIFRLGESEQGLKVHCSFLRHAALRKTGPLLGNQRKRPTRGLSLSTSNGAARTLPPTKPDRNVSAEAARLGMFAA